MSQKGAPLHRYDAELGKSGKNGDFMILSQAVTRMSQPEETRLGKAL